MKFSEKWLRSWVNPALDSDQLAHALTMAGLEVEENEPAAPMFDRVIVAEVLSVTRHENADRLNVCTVNIGAGEPLQIVCGAPNVAAGVKVPCALVGAILPGDFKIKQAKVRGVDSFGMLCSADELGMPADVDGLLLLPADAPVGGDFRSYFELDDRLLTLKLTPNRADCQSIQGIARDVAAITGVEITRPAIMPVAASIADQTKIQLTSDTACPRYLGRIIKGVNAKAVTPAWMRRRLERSGVRAISAVVDITNYVLLELGQPMHAFDLAKIDQHIEVRFARPEESITLLNEKTIQMSEDMLVIADQTKALALAGIMGGAESAVGDDTQDILLESAFFNPAVIHGKSRRLGFGSDSSYRFERGVDFAGARDAIERATALVLEICGGQPGPVNEAAVASALPQRPSVALRISRVAKVLGVDLPVDLIIELLSRLGLQCRQEGDVIHVTPPTYRFDIEIEEDLIEEVARLYGYDTIPVRPPKASLAMLPQSEALRPIASVKYALAARDYQEVINYAFVDSEWEADFSGSTQPVKLLNPIASQMSVMRSSLLGGLISTLKHNLNRRHERVRLFEVGRVFIKQDDTLAQPEYIAGLLAGSRFSEQWAEKAARVDFYDAKADVESLLTALPVRFEVAIHPALHPGRSAKIVVNGHGVGWLGELHPKWVQKYDLQHAPVVFELDASVVTQQFVQAAQPISKFQSVRRDIAVVVDEKIEVQALLDSLASEKISIISEIALFDVYRGKGVDAGEKSLAFKIMLQDKQKTLTDEEVEAAVSRLVRVLDEKHGAKLRV
ncbi:phenylalanyl-tRNA synthetase beta chain [Chitinivorax tropicus]|uniref:Phenylalanine--tRNA ligase beta subunit n=1 Tax=Chitinivorax tropicus TaxID=714531 RepID=A0A840MM55_9PROT|nr:phenylalanine--tRNA ligase subunit beta [Chitinivorax tropicus]MBB5017792.1 phenylalanyl-tRNA synthetase beta chain [Chitinivorax tropicus]